MSDLPKRPRCYHSGLFRPGLFEDRQSSPCRQKRLQSAERASARTLWPARSAASIIAAMAGLEQQQRVRLIEVKAEPVIQGSKSGWSPHGAAMRLGGENET